MGDFDPVFVETLAVQSWALYGVGMFLIIMRLYARIHRLGIKGLQADDYLMVFAAGLYTMLIVCLNAISGGGGSNLYPPEEFPTFTQMEIDQRVEGSKIVVASEQAMLNVIYIIKACMLIMYGRLTLGLQIERMVFYLSIYVAVGWLATEIAFFTACTPFVGYWSMPPTNSQCTTLQHYAIVQACFNISSDALMLCIPLPLMMRLNAPWKQKAILMVIFSMGTFVILAAILTKVFNLANIYDPSYMLWYTREASVAIYVSNLPMIWPLLREWFPALKALTPGQKISSGKAYGVNSSGLMKSTATGGRHASRGDNFGGKPSSVTGIVTTIHGKGESTDDLAGDDETEMRDIETARSWEQHDHNMSQGDIGLGASGWESHKDLRDGKDGGITLTTTVQISEEHVVDPGRRSPRTPSGSPSHERDLEKGAVPKPGFKWDFGRGEEKR